MPTIGLIVEGDSDIEAYSPLIQRENCQYIEIHPRPRGKSVSGTFVNILRGLKYASPVPHRVAVVGDAHRKNPTAWCATLAGRAQHLVLPFPVEWVVNGPNTLPVTVTTGEGFSMNSTAGISSPAFTVIAPAFEESVE
jgi:hypothetical protein